MSLYKMALDVIRAEMEEQKLTPYKLAQKMERDQSWVHRVLNDQGQATFEFIDEMFEALGKRPKLRLAKK